MDIAQYGRVRDESQTAILMHRRNQMTFSTCRANLLPLFLIVILLCSATGCGGGGDSAAEGQTADHGAALSMEFVFMTDSGDTGRDYDRAAAFDPDACRDWLIDTIQVDIRGNSDDAPITSMSFNCSDHQGTISGLPEQTELSVQVAGLVADQPNWSGRIDGIVLGQGENRALVVELSYVGNDNSPPALVQVEPSDKAQDVPTSSIICAVFNEPLAPSSISEQLITAAAGASLPGSLSYDDARNAVCFTPVNKFDPDVIYTAFLNGEVRDAAGNLLALYITWQFTTQAGDWPDYTINASAGPGGTISPSGVVTVSRGADQSFSISPATGFYLSELYVDRTPVDVPHDTSDQTYSFNNVTSGHTIEASFAVSATLLHRWQFNGDLSDIGASQAQVIDPDNFSATGDWVLGTEEVTLRGGAHNQAAYISLGDNLLPDTSFTIEIWGSHLSVGYWDPIWFIGKDDTTYLTMYWNTDNDIQTDLVEFRDLSLDVPYYVYDSYSPLTLDAEYHIVFVAEKGATGQMQLRWYAATSSGPTLGAAKGNIAIPMTLDLFDDAAAWLGRSPYSSENVANASYNEVRIWNGALTPAQLEFLHKLGPNNLEGGFR
jgi:hypothetical protein